MKKANKKRNGGLIAYALMGIALLGVWKGTNLINDRLKALPVKSMPQVEPKPGAQDNHALFPVWIRKGSASKLEVQAGSSIDEVFRKKEEAKKEDPTNKPPEPVEVDYTLVLRSMAALDSLADNGAVLNGKFYPVGANIDVLQVPRLRGAPLIPILQAVDEAGATLMIGSRTVVLSLPKPG